MSEIAKVHILGLDEKLLRNVTDRVNDTRPAEVRFFTDLKEFLEKSIEAKPDLVGVSLSFPHKSVSQFPKIFKMALNVPVLTFGESQDLRTRKALSATRSDLKISGVITAHNLWMKIVNFQKIQEEEQRKLNEAKDDKEKEKIKNSVFLKGGQNSLDETAKNNTLNNLYKALDNPNAANVAQSNVNMVQSGDATKFKKNEMSHLNASDPAQTKNSSAGTQSENSNNPVSSGLSGLNSAAMGMAEAGSKESQNANGQDNSSLGSQGLNGALAGFAEDNNSTNDSGATASNITHAKGSVGPDGGSTQAKGNFNESGRLANGGDGANGGPIIANGDASTSYSKTQSKNAQHARENQSSDAAKKKNLSDNSREDVKKKHNQAGVNKEKADTAPISEQESNLAKKKKEQHEATEKEQKAGPEKKSQGEKEKKNTKDREKKQKDDQDPIAGSKAQNKPEEGKKKKEARQNDVTEESAQKAQQDKKESSDNQQDKEPNSDNGKFGKIKVADANELKKEADAKAKKKQEQENEEKQNVLKTCSKKALEQCFEAYDPEEERPYDVEKIKVFTVDMESYKGCLLISNSFKQDFSPDVITDFRTVLMQQLQEHGVFADISLQYSMEISVENYNEVVKEFCDFTVTHEDSSGKLLNVSFVQREVIVPNLSDSDKKDMYLVDIKVIPPQTPVNFDAFIYLPRNQRFVRYLKEGRSLSLKQAKRHTEEEDGPSQLYLPKDQKTKFIEFFIHNTLSWEFTLNEKKDVA